MAKRINWDEVSRRQRGQRQGTSNAYDELPPVGSWADQQRVAKPKKKASAVSTKKDKAALSKEVVPKRVTVKKRTSPRFIAGVWCTRCLSNLLATEEAVVVHFKENHHYVRQKKKLKRCSRTHPKKDV
jgi:hypothetical protein